MDVAALLLVRSAVLDLGAMGSTRDLAGLLWPTLHTTSANGLSVHASRGIGREFLSPKLVALERS